MALPPAGVDLQAKGFKEYIRRLEQIEKQQREVFDQDFKGTDKSFAQIQQAAKAYERQLEKTRKEQEAFRKEQEKTSQIQANLSKSLTGLALGVFSKQTAEAAVEAAKAANAFRGQRQALIDLAAQHGQSGNEILTAVRRGADGTISSSQAIIAANQAIQLGVAQTPQEFERLANVATTLALAAGDEAAPALQEFVTALGRGSIQILDNFNVSGQRVNALMDELSQQRFGVTASELGEAARQTLFLESALKVAGDQADIISQNLDSTIGGFDRLTAESENLKVAFGAALGGSGLAGLLANASITAQQLLAFISAGIRGLGAFIPALFKDAQTELEIFGAGIDNVLDKFGEIATTGLTFAEAFEEGASSVDKVNQSLDDLLQIGGEAAKEAFLEVAAVLGVGIEEPMKMATKAVDENTEAVKENEKEIEQLQQAIRQAEQLELSFARAAEDTARKLARSQAKLGRNQAKEREKLLIDQQKDLDEFESDRLETIAKAEKNIVKEREKTGKDRLKAQERLQRQLKQAQERFNLDRVQSERRFQIDDRRLRAEGDILALQQLREDFALQEQESAENFDLQKRQEKESGRDQIKEQEEQSRERQKELEERLADLKVNLEEQRAELLTGFDSQLTELQQSQLEQRQALIESYNEQQEDARINQQRQLEDLGRSLATQKDVTAEGAEAVAGEIENVFGQDGVADTIFGGFTERTESEFQNLFDNIADILGDITAPSSFGAPASQDIRDTIAAFDAGLPNFDDGGIVPGSVGSPQIIRAHGGETILPTHKMTIPAIPSQSLNVEMSGGFDIRGGEGAGRAAVQAAVVEMVDAVEIAVKRMARRN